MHAMGTRFNQTVTVVASIRPTDAVDVEAVTRLHRVARRAYY